MVGKLTEMCMPSLYFFSTYFAHGTGGSGLPSSGMLLITKQPTNHAKPPSLHFHEDYGYHAPSK